MFVFVVACVLYASVNGVKEKNAKGRLPYEVKVRYDPDRFQKTENQPLHASNFGYMGARFKIGFQRSKSG